MIFFQRMVSVVEVRLHYFHVSYVCKCKLCDNTAELVSRVTRRKRRGCARAARSAGSNMAAAKVLPLLSLRVLNEAVYLYLERIFHYINFIMFISVTLWCVDIFFTKALYFVFNKWNCFIIIIWKCLMTIINICGLHLYLLLFIYLNNNRFI